MLKPSEHTPLTSLRVAELARDAGLPDGVFQVVAGRGDAGAALTAAADMIFFTGSAATGKRVAQAAAARLVPVVLELGGKSPMIVLADADLPRAAHAAVWSGFAHSGQVCIRTERVLVEAAVADRFVELAAAEIARLRQAPPPLGQPDASRRRRRRDHVRPADRTGASSRSPTPSRAAARVVTGGARRADLPGQFFAPTLIADATPDMAVMREETFGPVLPVMRVADAEAALRAANDSPMGLSGSVWSRDARRAPRARAPAAGGQRVRQRRAGELLLRRGAARRHQGAAASASGTAPRGCASSAASRPSSRTTRCSAGCRRCSAAS